MQLITLEQLIVFRNLDCKTLQILPAVNVHQVSCAVINYVVLPEQPHLLYAQYVKMKLKQKNMSLPDVHLTVFPEIFYIMHVLSYVMILKVLQTLKSFVLY